MWKELGELFDLQMGKTPSRDDSLYWHGNNKWVSIADLSKSGKFISETKETISDLGVTESGIKKVDKDTVIMSFKLSVGKSAITADDMCTNEAIMAFNDRNILPIDKEWLYYYLSNFDWSKTGNKAVKGITLNKAILKDISINVPDLSEQRKIVARLTRLDRLYDYFCQQIVNLDQLVKSEFINDAALNSNQIAFVDKIVNHLVTNGTIDVQALQYPPFDKPVSIVRLFNPDQIKRLGSVMATISHNAERPTA